MSGLAPPPSARRCVRALLSLVKPRIAALLCLTGVAAAVAAGGLPPVDLAVFALAGLGMAGGSAALNCVYDRDIDPLMDRTADRPLATGDLSPRTATAFALALLAGAVALAAGPVSVGAVLVAAPALLVAYRSFARRGGDARAVRAFFTSNAFLAAVFVGWALAGIARGPPAALAAVGVSLFAVGGVWWGRPSLDGVNAAPVPGLATDSGRPPSGGSSPLPAGSARSRRGADSPCSARDRCRSLRRPNGDPPVPSTTRSTDSTAVRRRQSNIFVKIDPVPGLLPSVRVTRNGSSPQACHRNTTSGRPSSGPARRFATRGGRSRQSTTPTP
ncbi:MAG: UbiA family prenyltransferase [Haloarculaceae archaeon]